MLMVATGILNFIYTTRSTVLDVIPCDFVSNQILVQTVQTANDSRSKLNVVHATTSTKNPLKVVEVEGYIWDFVKYNPFLTMIKEPWHMPISNLSMWKFLMYTTKELPLNMMLMYSRMKGDEKQLNKV